MLLIGSTGILNGIVQALVPHREPSLLDLISHSDCSTLKKLS
jgi:hypothetical protein